MRVAIITPPPFILTAPAAAPAVLAAVLGEYGHEAMCFDISRFCVDRLLSEKHVLSAGIQGGHLSSAVVAGLAAWIPEVKTALASSNTYTSVDLYDPARQSIDDALVLLASAHGASRWTSTRFSGDHDRTDAESLFAAVRRGDEVFDRVLPEALSTLETFAPQLVAISLSIPDQLYAALRIGLLIRTTLPYVKVVLGGASATRIRTALLQLPDLFEFIDFLQLREGEFSIVALVDALVARRDPIDSVAGLYARRSGRVVSSPATTRGTFPLDRMPVPEFKDLEPGPYLSARPLLPVSTTRNCYFDKCTFCAISRSFDAGFRIMPAERSLEQAVALRARHPGAIFRDVSEAIPPPALLRYADLAAATGDPPLFEAYLRMEHLFAVPGVAQRLYAGGLRTVHFGLESASPGVLRHMRKEIDVPVATTVLRTFAEAGIWCHLFFIAGHPGETDGDHELTQEFLRCNRPWIHSVQAQPFGLAVDSDLESLVGKYEMRLAARDPRSLSFDLDVDDWGSAPGPDVARARAHDLRRIAYGEADDTLARSRLLWDAHRVAFALARGVPEIRGSSNLAVRGPSWTETTAPGP